MHPTQPTQFTQAMQPTQAAHPAFPRPPTIAALAATPALPTIPALAATPALPTTPALAATPALPTTPALAATPALPTTSVDGLTGGMLVLRDRGSEDGADRVPRAPMEIPKDQILDLLRKRGDDDKAAQAEQELPDQVDPEQHGDLLSRVGVDPKEIVGGLGGVGDKLGL
jgi:hypothetical protein